MKSASRPGKAFEELVARIETILAPSGAVVKSPDYIQDLVTKRLREVDASIRIQDGDSIRLITVECRDHRKGKQDDRWIEQLVTKREKIGAALTIAVSSSGFSESAITSASHFGLELRRLDQITDAEIAQQWADVSKFAMSVLQVEYFCFSIALFDLNDKVVDIKQLPPTLIQELSNDLTNTRFLKERNHSQFVSAADFCRMVDHARNVKEGEPIKVTFGFDLLEGDWYVDTLSGETKLSRVLLGYEFSLRVIPVPIQSIKQYASTDKPIMELIEGNTDDVHGQYKVEAVVRLNRPVPSKARKPRQGKLKK